MFESKSMTVAFDDRDDLFLLRGSSQTELTLGKVQTLGSAVGLFVGMKIESRMLIVSSLKSAWKIHAVLEEWPIIRRYSSILLPSVLFSFVGGLSHSESRGGPSSVMLEPDKSTPLFVLQLLYVILPFFTIWLNQEGVLERVNVSMEKDSTYPFS